MAATHIYVNRATNDTIIPRRNEMKSQIKQNHEFMSIQHQTTAPVEKKKLEEEKKRDEELCSHVVGLPPIKSVVNWNWISQRDRSFA